MARFIGKVRYNRIMSEKRRTHKKFQRLPKDERPGVKIQPLDIELMLLIYRHRLIESDALFSLFPNRSEQTIRRRLWKLFHNEYIDRPLAQRGGNSTTPGSENLTYAIDTLGARQIQPHVPFDIASHRWRQKNAELTVVGVDHVLDISKFVAGLAAATYAHDGTRLSYVDELISKDVAKDRPPGLFTTLRADVPWNPAGENEGTACDAIVSLDSNDRQILFVEIDRGTETIEPGERQRKSSKFWRDTSYLRKFLIYSAAFRARAHEKQLGLPVFRVLTVTTKPGRVAEMQQCFSNHLGPGDNHTPPGLFLFTDWQTLRQADDFLSAPYEKANGQPVSLLAGT